MESKHRREPDTADAQHAAAFAVMRRELAALGIERLELVIGESADPDVPSSPATWHARVREPHPFTPPGCLWDGEIEVFGFGDATAIAPVRAAVVAHMLPQGATITAVRLLIAKHTNHVTESDRWNAELHKHINWDFSPAVAPVRSIIGSQIFASSGGSGGSGTLVPQVLAWTGLSEVVDNRDTTYYVSVTGPASEGADDRLFGAEVTFSDPGPRNQSWRAAMTAAIADLDELAARFDGGPPAAPSANPNWVRGRLQNILSTSNSIQELMAGGFRQDQAFSLFRSIADLQVIDPNANAANITRAIRQIQSKGILQMEELQQQLADSGVAVGDVLTRIGLRLNVGADRVREMIRAGRISSEMGIQGIQESIQARAGGGPIGQLARDASLTLPGLIQRLRAAPAVFFDAVAEASGGAFDNLRGILREVVGMLNPAGAGFRSVVAIASSGFRTVVDVLRTAWMAGRALFEGVFGSTGTDAAMSLEDALRGVRDALGWVREPATLAKIRAFGSGLVEVWKATKPLRTGLLIVGGLVVGLVAVIGGSLATIAAAAVAVPATVVLGLSTLFGFMAELGPRALRWGTDLVQGLVQGITAGLEPLRTAARAMTNVVTSAITGGFAIRSPSRVMMNLGALTGEGFALGLNNSMPELAMPEVGSVPAPRLGSAAANAGAGRGPINLSFEVRVEGGGDPDAQAEAIRRILLPEIEAAIEQLAVAEGVA